MNRPDLTYFLFVNLKFNELLNIIYNNFICYSSIVYSLFRGFELMRTAKYSG